MRTFAGPETRSLFLTEVDEVQVELPELGVEELQPHEPDSRRVGAARGERDGHAVAIDGAGEVDDHAVIVDAGLAFAADRHGVGERLHCALELALPRRPGPRVARL